MLSALRASAHRGRCALDSSRRRAYGTAPTRTGRRASGLVLVGPHHLGPQHGLVQAELTIQLGHRGRLGLHVDDGVDALGMLGDLVGQPAPAPDVDLVDRPPSLRMTFRNVSSDGATVRSSRVGSRMTMISYGRIRNPSPPMVVCGHGLSVAGGSPASATGPGYRNGADLRNRGAVHLRELDLALGAAREVRFRRSGFASYRSGAERHSGPARRAGAEPVGNQPAAHRVPVEHPARRVVDLARGIAPGPARVGRSGESPTRTTRSPRCRAAARCW